VGVPVKDSFLGGAHSPKNKSRNRVQLGTEKNDRGDAWINRKKHKAETEGGEQMLKKPGELDPLGGCSGRKGRVVRIGHPSAQR